MRRCFRFVLFGLLLFITFIPTVAHALPYNSVVYGPLTSTNDGVQTNEVGVVAFGKYDAAIVALGYDGDFINDMSSDDRALLSNQETGGDFWSFAQKFTLAPDDDLMTLNGITWKSLNALYGYGNVWRGVYTLGDSANAKRDLLKILTDGSLGGGGGGGGLVSSNVFDLYPLFSFRTEAISGQTNYSYTTIYGDGITVTSRMNADGTGYSGNTLMDTPYHLSFPSGFSLPDTSFDTSSMNLYIDLEGSTSVRFYYSEDALDLSSVTTTSKTGTIKVFDYYFGTLRKDVTYTCQYRLDGITVSADGIDVSDYQRVTNGWSKLTTDNIYQGYTPAHMVGKAAEVAGPVIPPTNWPDAPETSAPTAPEVPEPSQPDLPSQPAQPTAPSLPDFPSNVIAPGTTYETFDIQAILDAMDEHCRHLQSAVYQGFSDYFDTFTPWLRDEFSTLRTFLREEDDWIVESISDEFAELRIYLKELAEWLADQMDFTITGGDYDDSTVVSWLKKIYYKLSGPSVNTKPVDPVGDPDGSWDWLKQLIDAILSALAGGAAALTGTLGELFQGIKDKFPFSIPWDIVAIVALLDAPPVTPSAVIEYDVFGAHVRYDIDLHFFDEQASVIRAMEDVLFCAFLLFKTDWLTGIFDGIGGFLGGKLKSTVKGA